MGKNIKVKSFYSGKIYKFGQWVLSTHKNGHTKESFDEVIEKGEIEENLERVSVKSGDMIYLQI